MDESPNPSENEDPGARLNHFYRPDEKRLLEALSGRRLEVL
jgi:hypothetical protein